MLYAIIMAGGSGTRFWPWSRKKTPKQLLKITGQETMIAQTVDRIIGEIPSENIYVVTTSTLAESIKEELPEIPAKNIISEPFGRNTAACIGLAATIISKRDSNAIMAVMTADHIIEPPDLFVKLLKCAEGLASAEDALITFGIKPTGPSVNYGYIQRGEDVMNLQDFSIYDVKCFTEKPDRITAEKFLKSGKYYWNSGIFVWSVNTILENINVLMPDLSQGLERIGASIDKPDESSVICHEYEKFENLSIDYGIMEKASNVKIIEADFRWDDVGSWLAIERLNKSDQNNNTVLGKYCGYNARGNIVIGDDKHLITTINVSDMIIVNTKDVTMVCNKNSAEDIKKLTELLKEKGYSNNL
ncbi:mannose-1-phosphate guanylyltransferase [Candidatus Scalindua japonica]|uniref:mannose-1-phosphate guanylyltransferase n=1 Tax=Candidatus Scalindua japonica TaxID=1284222 RepID=A0A286TXM3_9BACT|nr:mannose-1-phosphate guanylyltransferase [Candidatus Scalindua japonica]GAX60632.1 mannose-1-phosphate guanylyltransferase [Candidatus Scalindua japonica]